ncbi:MAG: restriction endonuclease [Verrucomicrobia bacterium]|nr:restriction endonuclease [Verrucomicrobiota bacterium]
MASKNLPPLTIKQLKKEAKAFAIAESTHAEPSLFGVTDGKAVGTYLEHKFQADLLDRYAYPKGSSAKGIDFPGLDVDIKVTSVRQPQSSCPFRSARQKIYGLGYSLLVFVYDKRDDSAARVARLNILHTIFVEKERTADFQTTSGLLSLLKNNANRDDVLAFFAERMLPVDEISAGLLADEVMEAPPTLGYLTISNALQWRLQYSRAIEQAGVAPGILRLK